MPAPAVDTQTDRNVRAYVINWLDESGQARASLARAIGLSPFQMNRRLNRGYPFQTDEVVKLAKYFGVPVIDLLNAK